MTITKKLAACFSLFFLMNASLCSVQADEGDRLFTLRVLPLLKEKCFGCHASTPDDLKGDYAVDSREALLEGGESGDASIVPGKPEDSVLYQAVMWEGYEMPPKENDRLTKQQTEFVRRWIELGAPWPQEAKQQEIREAEWAVRENEDGLIVDTSGGTADEWTYRRYQPADTWAFQPVKSKSDFDPSPGEADHPVDSFFPVGSLPRPNFSRRNGLTPAR